eukprot:766115-Amphidinium_carterae.1
MFGAARKFGMQGFALIKPEKVKSAYCFPGDVHLAEEFRQHWSRNFGSEDQPHFVDVPQPPAPEELDPEAEALRKQKA